MRRNTEFKTASVTALYLCSEDVLAMTSLPHLRPQAFGVSSRHSGAGKGSLAA